MLTSARDCAYTIKRLEYDEVLKFFKRSVIRIMSLVFAPIFLIIWLLLWLLPMILSGVMAQKQGRNVLLWVVLSFLFGWIPSLILLAFSGA